MSGIIPDHRKTATVIVSRLHDSGKTDDVDALPTDDTELVALSADLLRAINMKSAKDIADAFKAMFMACESQPHEEAGEAEGEGDMD